MDSTKFWTVAILVVGLVGLGIYFMGGPVADTSTVTDDNVDTTGRSTETEPLDQTTSQPSNMGDDLSQAVSKSNSMESSDVPDRHSVLSVTSSSDTLPGAGGDTGFVRLRLHLDTGWHVNANPPSMDYLIPLQISLKGDGPVELERVDYPTGRQYDFSFATNPVHVYEHGARIPVLIRGFNHVRSDQTTSTQLRIKYQACNDRKCLRPATKHVSLPMTS